MNPVAQGYLSLYHSVVVSLGGATPPGANETPRPVFRLSPADFAAADITVAAQRQILTAFPVYFLRLPRRLRELCFCKKRRSSTALVPQSIPIYKHNFMRFP